jgi:hypothetical protein
MSSSIEESIHSCVYLSIVITYSSLNSGPTVPEEDSDGDDASSAHAYRVQQAHAQAIVRQLLHHVVLVLLLLFLCYSEQDANHLRWRGQLERTYAGGPVFRGMRRNLDVWGWLEQEVRPGLGVKMMVHPSSKILLIVPV